MFFDLIHSPFDLIQINQNKIESKFISGLRVTDNKIIRIVEDVLLNEINPDLVNSIKKMKSVVRQKINFLQRNTVNKKLKYLGDKILN